MKKKPKEMTSAKKVFLSVTSILLCLGIVSSFVSLISLRKTHSDYDHDQYIDSFPGNTNVIFATNRGNGKMFNSSDLHLGYPRTYDDITDQGYKYAVFEGNSLQNDAWLKKTLVDGDYVLELGAKSPMKGAGAVYFENDDLLMGYMGNTLFLETDFCFMGSENGLSNDSNKFCKILFCNSPDTPGDKNTFFMFELFGDPTSDYYSITKFDGRISNDYLLKVGCWYNLRFEIVLDYNITYYIYVNDMLIESRTLTSVNNVNVWDVYSVCFNTRVQMSDYVMYFDNTVCGIK